MASLPPALTRYSILAVESDANFRNDVEALLEPLCAHYRATDSPEAFRRELHMEHPHILFIDLAYPPFREPDFYLDLRQELPEAVIIAFCTQPTVAVARFAIEMELDGFLPKPCTEDELVQTLSRCVRKLETPHPGQGQFQFLQNVFDSQLQPILVTDGTTIYLANKAFLHFFGVGTLKEFLRSRPPFFQSMLKKEECVHPVGERWLEPLLEADPRKRKIALQNPSLSSPTVFLAFLAPMEHNASRHVVTLMDTAQFEEKKQAGGRYVPENREIIRNERKEVMKAMESEFHRASRYGDELTMLLVRIEMDPTRYRTLNQNDTVFRFFPRVAERTIRPSDSFGRLDFNRYVIMASHTSLENGKKLAKRLIDELRNMDLIANHGYRFKFGIVQRFEGDTLYLMLKRATQNLAKAGEVPGNAIIG